MRSWKLDSLLLILGAAVALFVCPTNAGAQSSDQCLPAVADPSAPWTDTALPAALVGDWSRDGIWNIGIASDHVQISNLSWDYLHIQESGGIYRLIVHSQSGDMYRGQYIRLLDGAGGSAQGCLADESSTGVVYSEADAMTAQPGEWDLLANGKGTDISWQTVSLPSAFDGKWYAGDIWNIGLSPDCVQISNFLWGYIATDEISCTAGSPLAERIFRIIVKNRATGEYRAQYFRCLDTSGANPVMLQGSSGVVPTEAAARANSHFDWDQLVNLDPWGCPLAVKATSWGTVKALYR
jgi:hypothetical protein